VTEGYYDKDLSGFNVVPKTGERFGQSRAGQGEKEILS